MLPGTLPSILWHSVFSGYLFSNNSVLSGTLRLSAPKLAFSIMLLLYMYNPGICQSRAVIPSIAMFINSGCILRVETYTERDWDSVRMVVLSGTSKYRFWLPSTLWYSLILPGTLWYFLALFLVFWLVFILWLVFWLVSLVPKYSLVPTISAPKLALA
jgi:hypothetical protein